MSCVISGISTATRAVWFYLSQDSYLHPSRVVEIKKKIAKDKENPAEILTKF